MGERTPPALSTLQERLRAALPALIGLVLFLAALEVLRTELRAITWHGLITDLSNIPARRIVLALLLTAANYAVLTGYDFLAFMYIGRHQPWRRVAMTSFLAYAISNNVGFAMLSGAAVRYRLYTRWGITAEELSRIVFSYVVTFWLGLLLIGGLSLAIGPLPRELGAVRCGGPGASRVAADVCEPGLCRRGRSAPWPDPISARGAAASTAATCDRAARHFRFGVDDRRSGPVRAPAARQRPVSHASGSVRGVAAARARQPHSGRRGCIRGADGAPLEAVHSVNDAAAGADCVSGGVLPASAFSCGSRARRRRAPSAAIASGAPECHAGMVDRATDAPCARHLHVLVGCRHAGVGRYSRRGGPPRRAESRASARPHRAVAFRRQHRWRRPSASLSGPCTATRCGVRPDGRGHGRRHRGVADERR